MLFLLNTLDGNSRVGYQSHIQKLFAYLTLGQYLQPTPRHMPIDRFVTPGQFEQLAKLAYDLGFAGVASGPFVRSSYHAAEVLDRVREGIRARG